MESRRVLTFPSEISKNFTAISWLGWDRRSKTYWSWNCCRHPSKRNLAFLLK